MRDNLLPPAEGAGATHPRRLSRRRRVLAFTALCTLVTVLAVTYTMSALAREERADRNAPAVAVASGPGTIDEVRSQPYLAFRSTALGDTYGKLALVTSDDPAGPRTLTDLNCEVTHIAGGRGLCVWADRGVYTRYGVSIFDERFAVLNDLTLGGIPSRTRVSPDGRIGSVTVFVSGHSYAVAGFSTETTLIDLASGDKLANLEDFTVLRDGEAIRAPDFNFWGVTFAAGGERFYATLGTGGRTYLVEGDVRQRQVRVLRENVECPSLSPDGRQLVFKKRTGSGLGPVVWRFHALDLATMTERPLAEARSVDDQAAWLDDRTVAYAVPRDARSATTDTWAVPVDGGGSPRLLVPGAYSPVRVPAP